MGGVDRLEELMRADGAAGMSRAEGGAGMSRAAADAEAPGLDAAGESGLPGGRHRRARRGVPFLSVPASLSSVELRVGWGAVRGLLVVAVLVVAVLAGRWWWVVARADIGEPVQLVEHLESAPPPGGTVEPGRSGAATTAAPEGAGPGANAMPTAEPGSTTEPEPTTMLVHVAGQVSEPGVVEVPVGARVLDVVEEAGGLTKQADASALNLARAVVDGEQVWVGRPGEDPPASAGAPPGGATGGGPGTGGGTGGGAGGSGAGRQPVDLNSATQADLESLPGVGPVTAERILAWREENGRFSTVEELLEVSGIGERTLERLAPMVGVG